MQVIKCGMYYHSSQASCLRCLLCLDFLVSGLVIFGGDDEC